MPGQRTPELLQQAFRGARELDDPGGEPHVLQNSMAPGWGEGLELDPAHPRSAANRRPGAQLPADPRPRWKPARTTTPESRGPARPRTARESEPRRTPSRPPRRLRPRRRTTVSGSASALVLGTDSSARPGVTRQSACPVELPEQGDQTGTSSTVPRRTRTLPPPNFGRACRGRRACPPPDPGSRTAPRTPRARRPTPPRAGGRRPRARAWPPPTRAKAPPHGSRPTGSRARTPRPQG